MSEPEGSTEGPDDGLPEDVEEDDPPPCAGSSMFRMKSEDL